MLVKAKGLLLAFCVCLIATESLDAKAASQDPYDKCMSSASDSFSMMNCGKAEIARQEHRLSDAWKNAFACFDNSEDQKEAKQQFLVSQRLWVKWKDSACSFYSDPYFGTMGSANDAPVCKMIIISDRAKWLEQFAKDGECR